MNTHRFGRHFVPFLAVALSGGTAFAFPSPGMPNQVGVYRAGQWILDTNNNHQVDPLETRDGPMGFGETGDIPVTLYGHGPYSINAIFRSNAGGTTWFVDSNSDFEWNSGDENYPGGYPTDSFGEPGDIAITGSMTYISLYLYEWCHGVL